MLFVALLARLVWSVATAEAIPEGIMNATHTPGYLRSDAAVATSERTSNFEERVNLPNINSILEKTQSKINSKLQVWRWRLQQKKTDDVFELLQLDKTDGNNPFRSSVFSQWEKFVRNTQSDGAVTGVIFNTLSRHYSDDASLAEVLVAGTMIETTQYLAHDLLLYQIVQWEEQRKTASDVFALLKLDKTDANPFESPVFSQWENFARKTQSDEAEDGAVYKMLSDIYSDDAALAEDLVAASTTGSTRLIVEKLLTAQIKWWKTTEKSSDKVFTRLKLNEPNANPFENPVFSQWEIFVKTVNPDSAKIAAGVMFNTLSHHYSNDALAENLLAASETDCTKLIAAELRRFQWFDKMFTLMELKQADKNPFENPSFAQWVTFIKKIKWDTLKLVTGVMFNIFLRHYSDDAALAEVLVAGTTIEKTKSLVEDLKLYQVEHWEGQGKTANDVFMLLKLDKTDANPFENPVFSQWEKFVRKTQSEEPIASVVLNTLSNHYNDEAALAKVLVAGTMIETTKSRAEALKMYQIEKWKRQGKTADDVFALLKLGKTSDDSLFRSPVISMWFDFALAYGRAGYSAMYSTLLRHFKDNDDALVKALLAEMKIASKDMDTPQILRFRLLKGQLDGDGREGAEKLVADDKADLIAEGTLKTIWDNFMGLWGKTSSKIIDEFEEYFSDEKISVMLATTTAENIFDIPVKELQEHQFRLWNMWDVTPDKYKTKLLKGGISNENIEKMVGEYAEFVRIHKVNPPSS